MNTISRRSPANERGSAILAVVFVVVVLAIAVESVIRFSTNTYRASVRQSRIEEAKLVAESEMEYLYFRWQGEAALGTTPSQVGTELVDDGYAMADVDTLDSAFAPTTASRGWRVSRTLEYKWIVGTSDGSATGLTPDGKTGKNYYYEAKVRVQRDDPIFGLIEYKAGRRFIQSDRALFQNSVFYQGDLEMAAGSDMIISGPITSNGSVYIGSQTGRTLTITSKLRYYDMLNGSTDPVDGTIMRKPGVGGSTSTLVAPIFDPDTSDAPNLDPVVLAAQRRAQASRMTDGQENFVGGVDVAHVLEQYPDAYRNSQGVVDANEVYRSVIAPPPTDTAGDAITEDPVVASRRMYNRAGLVITVKEDSESGLTIDVGHSGDPDAYNGEASTYLNSILPPTKRRAALFDKRENREIKVTTLDVTALGQALQGSSVLRNAFNGVVYIHDATDGGDGNGIRLTNGATTPNILDGSNQPKGFSIVTNNGLYIQGDYNTTQISEGSEYRNNPAALMGDAVTLLSAGWDDANSTENISSRLVTSNMEVRAAILTGNTPSSASANSGGVQNLVRLMENWAGYRLSVQGSLGQLFTSKFFDSAFKGSNEETSSGSGDYVYRQPSLRTLEFDTYLASRPPGKLPSTTKYLRGDYFTW